MNKKDAEIWIRMAERNANLSDCCKDPENLEVKFTGREDLKLHKCKVCGRRHFELDADALKVITDMKKLLDRETVTLTSADVGKLKV